MEAVRILVVDDEMIIARDIELTLQRMGFTEVRIANSSTEAKDLARRFLPSLILFDINLEEEMDGIRAATEILDFLYTRIIYVTAHSNRSVLDRAMNTNPTNYIIKPFDQEQLEVAVRVALNDQSSIPYGTLRTDQFGSLTPAEKKIIKLISENMKTEDIAEMLFLSPKTVENQRYNICKKLDLPPEKNSLIKWVFANKEWIDILPLPV